MELRGFFRSVSGSFWRVAGLALVVVFTSELLVALEHNQPRQALYAYLVKSGPEFLLAWRSSPQAEYRAFRFESLSDTLGHADRLGLEIARVSPDSGKLHRLWMQRPLAHRIHLFWKPAQSPFTHRLTFQSESDARYFFRAFEQGAYSESPFGHSVFFRSRSTP